MDILKKYGVFTERINWETHFFIPTEKEAGIEAIEQIIKTKPVASLTLPYGSRATDVTIHDLRSGEEGVTLDFMGLQSLYEATAKLLRKINPKAAPNVKVKAGKKEAIGVVSGLLSSPSRVGKIRYYVVHGKNAVLKQERLRGIAQDKLLEIYNLLKQRGSGKNLKICCGKATLTERNLPAKSLNRWGRMPPLSKPT